MSMLSRIRTLTLRSLALSFAALGTSGANASLVVNGGFETGTIQWNGAWGTYCYSQASCQATGWTGNYLLTSTGSWAWGYPGSLPGFDAAAQGVVVAGLQGTEFIQQTLSIGQAGNYTLTWRDAGRPSSFYTYYSQDYDVLIDGIQLTSMHTNAGQAWGNRSLVVSLQQGNHVLEFRGKATAYSTSFLDQVSLIGAPDQAPAHPVPEPQTLVLLLAGLGAAGLQRRRKLG